MVRHKPQPGGNVLVQGWQKGDLVTRIHATEGAQPLRGETDGDLSTQGEEGAQRRAEEQPVTCRVQLLQWERGSKLDASVPDRASEGQVGAAHRGHWASWLQGRGPAAFQQDWREPSPHPNTYLLSIYVRALPRGLGASKFLEGWHVNTDD